MIAGGRVWFAAALVLSTLAAPRVHAQEAPLEGDGVDPPTSDASEASEASDADEDASEEDSDDGVYTVVVVAERRVEMARQALYEVARDAGFRRIKIKDDRVILRHEQSWKGDIVVHDDGRVKVKRQPVRFEPPVKNPRPVDYLWCVLFPLCIRPAGQTYGARKWKAAEARALATIRPEMEQLSTRISALGLARRVEDLPVRLDALWERGEALDGGDVIPTPAGRREAVATFWLTRTDTPEGQVVRDVIQAWARNVIQYSDDPFTADELAQIRAASMHPEPFLPERVPASSPQDSDEAL